MAKGSPRHGDGEQDLGHKKDSEVSALRSVDDGAWVGDLGLTLSPESQVQGDADYEYKYDAESPLLLSNGSCGRSPPWRSGRLGICSDGSNITETEKQDEPIGSISSSCEYTQPPNYDRGLGKLASALSFSHNFNTSQFLAPCSHASFPHTHRHTQTLTDISTIIKSHTNTASSAYTSHKYQIYSSSLPSSNNFTTDSTKMDAGSTHNVQPYGPMMEHHATGAQADRRTRQLLSKEQALQRHHHQVIEYEKQVQAQARNQTAVNTKLHNENQALRHHVAQLRSQFETVMLAQAQTHEHAAMIDQLRGDNHALHVQVAQLKNELEVNTRDYHHSYRQLQHQSEIEKRDLYRKQAALEAELNQYKSATTMFSGMSVIDAQRGVMKLRRDLAQAVKARQHVVKAADEAVKKNMARCKATVNQAKDTIARLTQERNLLDATNNALIDMMPIADAKMKETSTKDLLESAMVGSSQAIAPMMPRGHTGNYMTSTKDLLACFNPNQPRPAQHPVTVDLTGEYPSPADTPATHNISTMYTGIEPLPAASSFNNAVETYTDDAQAQFAPDLNIYGLFPGALELSDLPLGHDFLATYTSSAQSSSSPNFDSTLLASTSVPAYPIASGGSDLLEANGNSAPSSITSIFNITPQTHAEVAASSIAPIASDTAEAHPAGAQSPAMLANANATDTSTQVTVFPGLAPFETHEEARAISILGNALKRDEELERAEAEAVAEAEAAWIPYGLSGYSNGSLEQIKDSYGGDVKGYRSWLLDNHAKNKRHAQWELA